MVVAETLVGIQLVQSSCKAIKSALKTAEDVNQISGLLENMFKGKEQLKEQDHPIATRWSKFIKGKTGRDNFMQLAIQETVNEKLAQEEMRKVKWMLNRRFGNDTWDHILKERDKKKKAYEDQMEMERIERDDLWEKVMNICIGILVVGFATAGMVFYVKYRMNR